jgi:hypothetical protein
MDDGQGGDFILVLDTVGFNKDINQYLAQNLQSLLYYRFYVVAYNYNVL